MRGVGQGVYTQLFWVVDPELIGHVVQGVEDRLLVEDVGGGRRGGSSHPHKASRDPWNTHSIFFPLSYRPKKVNKTEEIF